MTPGNELRCASEEFMMRSDVQRLGEYVTAALLGRLTQPRESPRSGDDLLPAWRRAWARRESSHGRQGTCSEIPGR